MSKSFKDLEFKSTYETLSEDPLSEFYVPALESAVSYDRIAGYFSSTSLALASRGIAGLIFNGGHMRLIVSPIMTAEDIEVIKSCTYNPQSYIESIMVRELENLSETLMDEHVRALGWMLASGLLDMRVAYIVGGDNTETNALFHQKVGLMEDGEGNRVSFSGSINETAAGWLRNSEEFKVFREWDMGQRNYYQADRNKFDEYWNGKRPYARIFEPSDAFKEHVMRVGEGFDIRDLTLKNYLRDRKRQEARDMISLFPYQEEAVAAWEANDRRLLFEMATGTGKTRTAIACVNIAKADSDKFICITAAPEVTLVRQWQAEYESLGVTFDTVVNADGTQGGSRVWKPKIRQALSSMRFGSTKSLLVLVTHASSCLQTFTSLFWNLDDTFCICFVGDEVHGLGAKKRQAALLGRYDLRIGLSATPSRWFDDKGTRLLVDYFGDNSFYFGIREAQDTINPLTSNPFLAPYRYELVFVMLNDEESDRYFSLSKKIGKLSLMGDDIDDEEDSALDRLLTQRADITKNAAAKLPALDQLIREKGRIDKTLVFTSPQQIDSVCHVLSKNRICNHKFTQEQGTRKLRAYGGLSEREYLIREFKNGGYQALVAIKCLDEGIDIPEASCAILMSSSTNPREYIQRIGRVIRFHEDKEEALIIDFVVEPNWERVRNPEVGIYERRMFERELKRVRDMAQNATNGVDVLLSIDRRLQ